MKYWLFSFLILFVIWNLSNLASLNLKEREWILLSAQVGYRILFLLPAFILALTLSFWSKLTKNQTLLRNFLIFFFPILLLILSFPNFNFRLIDITVPQKMTFYVLNSKPGVSFYGMTVLAFAYLLLSVSIVLKKENKIINLQQKHTFRLLIYGLIGLFIFFFSIHIPYSKVPSYSLVYLLRTAFLFTEVFFFYVVIDQLQKEQRPSLSDKFLSYLIFTALIAVYFILIKLIIELINAHFDIHSFYFDAVLIFILTLFFQPAEALIHQFIFKNIKNQIYQYRSNFLTLTNELMEMFPDEQLLQKVRQFILTNFHCENVLLFRSNEAMGVFEEVDLNDEISSLSALVQKMIVSRRIIEFVEIKQRDIGNHLYNYFIQRGIRLFIPIRKGKELIMFFALGGKTNHKEYTSEELEVLSIFSNEISLYLQRNMLLEQIHTDEREKFRLEKLAALGQLTAGIAHEIRNPLNTISTAAQTLMNKAIDNEAKERMALYIEEEVKRLSGLISEFLELSRIRTPQLVEVNMENLLSKLTIFLQSKNKEIHYFIDNRVNGTIYSDGAFLYQVLSNLSLNAIEAIEGYCHKEHVSCASSTIKITSKIENASLFIIVENNGPKIPTTIREQMFDPFFTTKEQGTGLGLSLVENMVKSLSGKISVKSTSGITQFLILIPLKHEYKT